MGGRMAFLYGDSTPSPLESNFLEFLRDALDFSVLVLHADANIAGIHERKHACARSAEEEIERLQTFGRTVVAAIHDAPKGEAESETARCAAQLAVASADAVNAATDAISRTLADEIAQADADESAQRAASFKALEALLLPHAPPDAKVVVRVERQPDGAYAANVRGESATGLRWRIDLAITEEDVFHAAAPLERLSPQMEFLAPEQTGWLKKEVKPRPQRLDRFFLAEATDDGREVVLKLRTPAGDPGFEIGVDPASSVVRATKTGKEGDMSFEVSEGDTPKLVSLAEKLRGALAELKGARLVEATFESGEFILHPVFRDVVERLVAQMAPIVKEILRHSLTQTELVIRRLLSNERREEIFVAKATLRDKYRDLPPEQRALFDGFGLDTLPPPAPPSVPPSTPPPAAQNHVEVVEAVVPPAMRSEVAPSQPPPPPSWRPPPSWPPGTTPRWRQRPPPRSSS
jgi:hypothetical protein